MNLTELRIALNALSQPQILEVGAVVQAGLADSMNRSTAIAHLLGWATTPQRMSELERALCSGGDEVDFEEAVRAYRAKAEALYSLLPDTGFAMQLRCPIALEEIHVPLRVMVNLGFRERKVYASADDAEDGLGQHEGVAELELAMAFADAERRGRSGLAILGDPGSGKTTHLWYLLLRCLREGSAAVGLPEGMLPVFLPLRELRDVNAGLDGFVQQQLNKPHHATPPNFGARLLKRGKVLFLLDGLDEVVDKARRQQVTDWVRQAVLAYRECRFVVTCRYAGYTPDVDLGAQFLELHIRPLGAEQADELVRRWYRIVERGMSTDAEQAKIKAEEKAAELIAILHGPDFRAQRVFELTRNPLLLVNICLVHRWRNKLPKGRARLYQECTDVLLEHWRSSRKLDLGLEAEQSRRVLQPAALYMHGQEGRTRATAAELAPVIEPALASVKWQGGTAREFLARVRDVSGLLTGWDQEHYGFMHLSFQEYLAAREIRSRAFTEPALLAELATHFGQSWWQEVTLLLLALDDPSLFVPFMRELVKLPQFVAHPALVAACLDDAAEVNPQPFLELLEQAPGTDRALWERQACALRTMEALDARALDRLAASLSRHPSPEIRERFAARRADHAREARGEILVAPRGGYELVALPAGQFMMGSPAGEKGRWDAEGPQHLVTVKAFAMGRYPVTNEEYGRFLQENPGVGEPKYWADHRFNQARQPVVGVRWDEARRYAEWSGLRLPSEAEWEYACRAGTQSAFNDGSDCTVPEGKDPALDRLGWYEWNSGGSLHSVGEKTANPWGLYDMHGNVWEWCEDHWHDNCDNDAPQDGSAWVGRGAAKGARRVIRGGSWVARAGFCRCAYRYWSTSGDRLDDLGFRLVLARSSMVGSGRSLEQQQAGAAAGKPGEASAERGPGGAGAPRPGYTGRARGAHSTEGKIGRP